MNCKAQIAIVLPRKHFKKIKVDAAQENEHFPALFLPRVGFGAGFSKKCSKQAQWADPSFH